MSNDRIYPVIALLLLAALTFWLERITRSPEEVPRVERTDPDFIGSNIRMTSFDEAGQPHYELTSERIVHYPLSDVTDLIEPRLLYETAEGELRIRAREAEAAAGLENVLLEGEVEVERDATVSDPAMRLETERMRYWPDTQRAFSDAPVVLKHGNITAYGNGLRADNISGVLELVGDARVQMPRSPRNRQ
ncbi:LPS export ABC transporter periplasmic protein LptC [Pseudazoarcus pumilus]|uniref:LPS export ABC transporter periplasmic protein LptC n=1 Tax=Pseudazoarcus pumilus TaxID=2067960 RepID=A0A2I6S5J5_9RHOO|nr:LPS export ABC transporter periplasmic protein LptC [Pseudazoarcus pumilus]AUN94518.1 LPS export ABC transporter periplasmic protein LptC [Pseudazoarcus pumilus]